jgi:UrcA family protein
MSTRTHSRNHQTLGLALAAVAATLTMGFASAPALSGTPAAAAPQVTVNYADLNLSTDAGARTLHARIERAARRVCVENGTRGVAVLAREQRCMASAIDAAVGAIDSPRLAAVHAAGAARG